VDFLGKYDEKAGFDDAWINMMMACAISVKYQVRFNSEETDMFTPTRGLRQGILSLLICSYCAWKDYQVCCCMKKKLVALMG
jgi:hypothetical protein